MDAFQHEKKRKAALQEYEDNEVREKRRKRSEKEIQVNKREADLAAVQLSKPEEVNGLKNMSMMDDQLDVLREIEAQIESKKNTGDRNPDAPLIPAKSKCGKRDVCAQILRDALTRHYSRPEVLQIDPFEAKIAAMRNAAVEEEIVCDWEEEEEAEEEEL